MAAEAEQPRHGRQFGAYMPRRSADRKALLFRGRRLGQSFQIDLDASGERGFHFIEGSTAGGEVEVDANCLPVLPAAAGIAPKRKAYEISIAAARSA